MAKANLGPRVKTIREELGLQQAEVAERGGVARNTVSRLELGNLNPGVDVLVGVAEGLGVHPAELFKDEREPFTTTRGVTISPKGTPVLISAFGEGRGEGFTKPSINNALSQLRILTADWERGGLTDESLVEGLGEIHRQLQQLVASEG